MKNINRLILDSLNRSSFRWAIIHKLDEIFIGCENDIDIFISKNDFKPIINLFLNSCKTHEFKIIRQKKMTSGISFSIYCEKNNEFAKFDFVFDMTVYFISFLKKDLILENVNKSLYPTLKKDVATLIVQYKNILRKNPFKFRFNSKYVKLIPTVSILGFLSALYFNLRNKPGKFVILLGPDGSGKTTISNILTNNFKKVFFSARLYHFNFKFFPRLNKFKLRKRQEPDYTLPNSGTYAKIQSRFKSVIYTIYYGIEIIITSNLRGRQLISNGCLLIFDRYLHDYFFQRSYRKAPVNLLKFILKLCYKPDLIIYLDGEAESINKRKNELSPDEIKIQQNLIKNKLIPFWISKKVTIIPFNTTINNAEDILPLLEKYFVK